MSRPTKYVILAQSPDGKIGVYAVSDDEPTTAVVFDNMKEVRREIRDCILLQGLPIQIVKLDMVYSLEERRKK
jgi:hypothetical protein